MLVEHNRAHVGLIHHHVDDHERGFGIIRGDFIQNVSKRETGHHDRVRPGFGQTTQRLFALGFRLHLDFAIRPAGFLNPTLRAVIGRFVEGFVELAAQIEDQGRIGACGAGTQCDSGSGTKQFGHHGHLLGISLMFLVCRGPFPPPHTRRQSSRLWARLGPLAGGGSTGFSGETA